MYYLSLRDYANYIFFLLEPLNEIFTYLYSRVLVYPSAHFFYKLAVYHLDVANENLLCMHSYTLLQDVSHRTELYHVETELMVARM